MHPYVLNVIPYGVKFVLYALEADLIEATRPWSERSRDTPYGA